jgi:hypothetical protein
MDKRLERIEQKLDDQNEHLASIDATLQAQAIHLEHHIKRTDKLEDMVLPLNDLRKEIKFIIKVIYFISAVAAIIEAIRACR